jgi:hypothetical protein
MKESLAHQAAAELNRFLPAVKQSGRFPPACRSYLRSLPGNRTCVDCGAPNPEWASVTHGCLLCLQCSGRHRSFGVRTSVVRSVDMDHWTPVEILAMLEGCNEQLTNFFDRHQMGRTSNVASRRYHTKAALFYRTHLSKHVAQIAQMGNYDGREASRRQYSRSNCNSPKKPVTSVDTVKETMHLSKRHNHPRTICVQ